MWRNILMERIEKLKKNNDILNEEIKKLKEQIAKKKKQIAANENEIAEIEKQNRIMNNESIVRVLENKYGENLTAEKLGEIIMTLK